MEHAHSNSIPAHLYQRLHRSNLLAHITVNNCKFAIKAYLPEHADRNNIESYIARVFDQSFNAKVNEFLPLLVTLEDHFNGEIIAALGLRFADQQVLFAERYSHKEIDHLVLEQFNILDNREHIVEIGSLATTRSGHAHYLFLAMTKILTSWKFQWLTFTAIPAVVNVFRKIKLNPIEICNAKLKDLVNSATDWGSYYDKNPKVMIGDVFAANHYLEKHKRYQDIQLICN